MTDEKIEEIYTLADAALRNGQKFFRVHCFPFRMTDENMRKHSGSEWDDFWQNLRTGYDWFEQQQRPPDTSLYHITLPPIPAPAAECEDPSISRPLFSLSFSLASLSFFPQSLFLSLTSFNLSLFQTSVSPFLKM